MPLTYSSAITAIANGNPVNAAIANQPHTDLEDRTDEALDYINNLEDLIRLDRGISMYSTGPVSWNGSDLLMTSGSIFIVQHGDIADDLVYEIPFNELTSFFSSASVGTDQVFYVNVGSFTQRYDFGAGTIVAAELDVADDLPAFAVPVGRENNGKFVFAFGAGVLDYGISMYVGATIPAPLVYKKDFSIDGVFSFELNGTGIDYTNAADVTIYLHNPTGTAQSNVIPAGTYSIAEPGDEAFPRFVYVDLDLTVDAANVTPTSATSYTPAANRVLLFYREAVTLAAAYGEYWDGSQLYYVTDMLTGHIIQINDTTTTQYRYGRPYPLDVNIDTDGVATVLVPSTTGTPSDTIVFKANTEFIFNGTNAADIVTSFANAGAGDHQVSADSYAFNSASSRSAIIRGIEAIPKSTATMVIVDFGSISLDSNAATQIVYFPLNTYIPDGATVTEVTVRGLSTAADVNIECNLRRITAAGASSVVATHTGTPKLLSSGSSSVDMNISASFTLDKSTYNYLLEVSCLITGGSTSYIECIDLDYTTQLVVVGG